MTTVTQLTPRSRQRLNNAECQLGRVYLVMRDATYWLQLHEIGDIILDRFNRMDSHAAISARLRDLRAMGFTVARRDVKGPGNTRPCEYRLFEGHDEGGAA